LRGRSKPYSELIFVSLVFLFDDDRGPDIPEPSAVSGRFFDEVDEVDVSEGDRSGLDSSVAKRRPAERVGAGADLWEAGVPLFMLGEMARGGCEDDAGAFTGKSSGSWLILTASGFFLVGLPSISAALASAVSCKPGPPLGGIGADMVSLMSLAPVT